MAERRMFTQKITESDAFLNMPLSTQALYFHLCMYADDDGFVKNPKRICRMIGGNDDDYNLLLAKNFVLSYDNGVIVIKHWRMHNLLRKDRYHPSEYTDEKELLYLKNNGAYTLDGKQGQPLLATKWQPNGNQMATEDSIGKDSIGKDIKEKDVAKATSKKKKPKSQRNVIPPTVEMVEEYCKKRKNGIDAQAFVDFYASKGWFVGKTKMKDWEASVRTWERNNKVGHGSRNNDDIDQWVKG